MPYIYHCSQEKATRILAVGCAVLLFFLIFFPVAGIVWWDLEGRNQAEAALADGKSHGPRIDHRDCAQEALRRAGSDDSLDGLLTRFFPDKAPNSIFLKACLETSKPSRGFCKEVPAATDIVSTAAWRRAVCEKRDTVDGSTCRGLLSVVQNFCETSG
ncbi:MAG: hypothetical protein GY856_27020 [bacterium]|nr:hypothetical protein [bacterium]